MKTERRKIKTYALLMCAGRGERAALGYNKLLRGINSRPIVDYALDAFTGTGGRTADALETVLVCAPADTDAFAAIARARGAAITAGGETRTQSVRKGLSFLKARGAADDDIVLICDGARPGVSPALIRKCAAAARRYGGAVAALPARDAVKTARGGVITGAPSRDGLFFAQTPQAFKFGAILRAYAETDAAAVYADDAEVYAAAGGETRIVPGEESNYKITTAADIARFERDIAAAKTARRAAGGESNREAAADDITRLKKGTATADDAAAVPFRVGTGSDTHRLVAGRPLILCGVKIPHDRGAEGHSDADAAAHALADALLSAAGLRDIGFYFPDASPEFAGADSMILLAKARETLLKKGFGIINVAITVHLEKPKIADYIDAMRENLARVLQIPVGNAGVGAKTGEGLGFIGRGEAVSASAVSLLRVLPPRANDNLYDKRRIK